MSDDPSDDPDEENPAIHGSESGPDDASRGSAGDAGSEPVADTGPVSAEDADVRTTPHLADQGKPVVDSNGDDLGIVSDVDGETLYVEPDPTLTEKVLSRLHWRSGDRDEVQVPAERIRRVDDDEVVLDVEREAEFRSEP